MNARSLLTLSTLIALLFALPAVAAEKVSLRLSWDHQFSSAGFYVAQWLGYYDDAGLEVEIKPGFTSDRKRHRAEDDILKGFSDFGVAAPVRLMLNGNSASFTIVAPLYQRSPVALFALKGTGLNSPADLTRLRVGHLPGGSSDAEIRSMLLAEGIDPGAVNFVTNKTYGIRPLQQGRLDVVTSYSTSLPWQAQNKGVSLEVLRPSAYGIEFYGLSLLTSRRLVAEKPGLVAPFRDASLKGWKYAMAHPEEIVQRIAKELPTVRRSTNVVEFNRFLAKEVRRLMLYPVVPVGHINRDRVRGMHEKLQSLGLVKDELVLTGFIFDPQRDQIRRDAILHKWLAVGLAVVFACVILFVVWTRSLRRQINTATGTLRESEERFRDVMESSSDWFWEMGPDLRFTFVSPQVYGHTGFPVEFYMGKTREELGPPVGNLDGWKQLLEDLEAHRPVRDFAYERIDATGQSIHIEVSGKPIHDAEGAFLGYRGAARDITAKIEAERQAIRSEERFQYAIENSSESFALFDADEKLVIGNTKFRENSLLGSPFLSTGTSFEEVVTALAEQGYVIGVDEHNKMEWIDERLVGFRTRTVTRDYQMSNGRWRHAQYDGLPDGSTIARYLDVTDRKRAENILHENEQRFRDFAETSSDWFWETDDKFKIIWVSFDEHPISGAPTPSLLGHRPWSWSGVEMEDPQAWNQLVETCLADRQPFRNFVVRARFPEIGVRDIRANAIPIFDEKGVFRGYRGASTDATQQIATEEQLRQAIKMEAIGQLTGGVAHDFNNLLAVTLPNAQVLESELEGRTDLLAMARSIIKASEHGAELIDRLLAFSRKQSLRPKTIDLGLLCSEMNGLLGRSLGEAIKIELITGDEARYVLADPHGVESALLNLAINARHAMPSGGRLTIEVEDVSVTSQAWAERWEGQPGAYVALRVTDTGTGMPAEVLSHAFEPFFTTKAVGQGSGLGLSMVYGFAQQSGGFVAMESEQGKGTTVTIYLPKAQADQTIAKAPKPDADIGNGRGETILVVEDAPAVRNATILLLNKLGYTALSAEDGAGALEVASSGERIDLLISDMVLPGGLNGIEICNRVRELRPGLKCLFMTGYSSVSDDDLPEGTEILSKPIWMDEFDTKLRQVFDS